MNALKQRWQSGCLGKMLIVGGVLVILFTCTVCGAMALVSAPRKTPSGEVRATGAVTPKALERSQVTAAPIATKNAKGAEIKATEVATMRPTLAPTPTATVTSAPTATPGPTATPAPTNTPMPTDTPVPPTNTPEPQAALQTAVAAALGEGNRDVPRIKDVYLGTDDKTIAVSWAINDNAFSSYIGYGGRKDVIAILKAVKASGAPFDVVNLFGSFSMVDKYGNASESPVVKLIYSKATVDRLNLDNILLTDTIYEAADKSQIHPEFSGE